MRRSTFMAAGLLLILVSAVAFGQRGTLYVGARMLIEKTGAITLQPKSGQVATVSGPLTVTGQATFTRDPANTTASSASVYINPATSASNEPLLTIADNGTARATVDKEGDATFSGLVTGGKFKGGSSAPTCVVGAAAGTGATCVVTGNDSAGQVTITTGSDAENGAYGTVTFNSAYSSAPFVSLTPANDVVVEELNGTNAGYRIGARATTGFEVFVRVTGEAPGAGAVFVWNYIVVQ